MSGFWLGRSAEKKAGHPAFCEREIIEAVRRHGRTKPKYPQEQNAAADAQTACDEQG